MFDIGTQVVVLASSTKKGLGPKKGSTGYISSQRKSAFADRINPHSHLSFLSMPTIVGFSKYGFEEKRRCEFRMVMNILPAFTGGPKKIDKAREVKNIIGLFQSDEFEKNFRWEKWALSSHNMHKPKLVVLAPVRNLKAENMLNQPMEARAWMESFLRNSVVGSLLRNNQHNNFYPQIDEGFMAQVLNAHRSRSITQKILGWTEGNPEEALTYIRTLSTAYNLRRGQQELDYFKMSVERNIYGGGEPAGHNSGGYGSGKSQPSFNFGAFFSIYTLGFFEENKIKEKEVIAEKSKSAQIRDIAKDMRYIRSAITELASKTIAKE